MSNDAGPSPRRRSARLANLEQANEINRPHDDRGEVLSIAVRAAKRSCETSVASLWHVASTPSLKVDRVDSLDEDEVFIGSIPAEESDSEFQVDSDDDYDSDEDENLEYTLAGDDSDDDYEVDIAGHVTRYIQAFRGGIAGFTSRRNTGVNALSRYGPIPTDPPPMCNDLSLEVTKATDPDFTRLRPRKRKQGDKEAASKPGVSKVNTASMLWSRQAGLSRSLGGWNRPQCCHLMGMHYMPNRPLELRASMQSRAYIGQYSHKGNLYVGAFQADRRVRIYNTEKDWQLVKDIHARNLRWTITDTALSKDQSLLLYATINPVVHMVSVNQGGVESEANVTEIHEDLHLDMMAGSRNSTGHFGIFSICWSPNGQEIAAATGDAKVVVFDMEEHKSTSRVAAHNDDVNAVAFMDDSPNIIASGSDDHLIKIWDRRENSKSGRAAGVLVGHTQGITHIDPKGDGRYLLSNSKDQTAKIWDIRKLISNQKFLRLPDPKLPDIGWDYRWMPYPGRELDIKHPHDVSVQTLRGHFVSTTLIRAYWSPLHTTGQRFVYSASADGAIYIYDIVSSKLVERLSYHRAGAAKEIIRDVSWHPYEPSLVSAGFDGAVVEWGYSTESMQHHLDNFPDTGYDNLEDRW